METFRFIVKVNNVYDYMLNTLVSTLTAYKNEIAGFIKEENLPKLKELFPGKEFKIYTVENWTEFTSFEEIRLIPEKEYFRVWDFFKDN